MTTYNASPVGYAIFGTVRGLMSQGSGVLAEAPVAIFEFDIGRQRDGLLHRIDAGKPLLFFRRIISEDTGTEANLVGTVSPCRDINGRNGFFGTSIAMPLDRLRGPHPADHDWGLLDEELHEHFEAASALHDKSRNTLQWQELFQPSGHDQAIDWKHSPGETLYLHLDHPTSDYEQLLRVMQAVAFQHGARYTTILVLHAATNGSVPISAPDVQKSIQALKNARIEVEREQRTPAPTVHSTPNREMSLQELTETVQDLQEDVDLLREEVRRLKGGRASTPAYVKRDQDLSRFSLEPDDSTDTRWLWLLGGAAVVLIAIMSLVLWMIFSGGSSTQLPPS